MGNPESEDRYKLKKDHDLSPFCDHDTGRYVLGCVKYDATRQQLEATDGRILAIMSADLGPADFFIDGKILQQAFDSVNNRGTPGPVYVCPESKLVDSRSGARFPFGEQEGRWPKLAEFFGPYEPTVIVGLKVESLERLVQYAKAAGEEVVRLGIKQELAAQGPLRIAVGSLRGVVMPVSDKESYPEITEAIWEAPPA